MLTARFLPDERVLSAIFESYMNIRKYKWGLVEDKPLDQVTYTGKQKIDVCIALLKKFKAAGDDFDAWVDCIYLCLEKRAPEDAQQPKNRTGGFFLQYLLDDPLLLYSIDAGLAYQISTLSQNEVRFNQLMDNLTTQHANEEATIKEAKAHNAPAADYADNEKKRDDLANKLEFLKNLTKYHDTYFKTHTLKRDPLATEFSEKSFDDFAQNAKNNKRSFKLCNKILSENKAPDATVQETAKPNPKPAVESTQAKAEETKPDNANVTQPTTAPESPLIRNSLHARRGRNRAQRNAAQQQEKTHDYGLRNR